jgi:hypothetical protein
MRKSFKVEHSSNAVRLENTQIKFRPRFNFFQARLQIGKNDAASKIEI